MSGSNPRLAEELVHEPLCGCGVLFVGIGRSEAHLEQRCRHRVQRRCVFLEIADQLPAVVDGVDRVAGYDGVVPIGRRCFLEPRRRRRCRRRRGARRRSDRRCGRSVLRRCGTRSGSSGPRCSLLSRSSAWSSSLPVTSRSETGQEVLTGNRCGDVTLDPAGDRSGLAIIELTTRRTSMPKTLLVPLDGSLDAERALPVAEALAERIRRRHRPRGCAVGR